MTMRIALISEHASPLSVLGGVDSGGQNVYVAQLARYLAAAGHTVDVFTRRDSPSLPEVVELAPGARVIHVPAGPAEFVRKEDMLPYMADFTACVLRFSRQQPYDLLHANFWMSGLVAADVKHATGLPFVITFHALGRVRRLHQGAADEFPVARFAIEDRLVAEADAIIAECPQDQQDLIELYAADPAHIRIIPCGYDPAEFWPVERAGARHEVGLDGDERIILQLGRMVPRKGVDNVVLGFARLVRDYGIAARLVVVGGESDDPDPAATPEIGRLQRLAEAEGVADRVLFTGRRARACLKYFYSAADVFVTTPWYEPFGMTPLEAMACATPVVGAAVGGIKYSVADGETGYLVPPKDPEALAGRLAALLADADQLAQFGARAQARAAQFFTWERVAGQIAGLYQDVLAAAPAAEDVAAVEAGFAAALDALARARALLPGPIARAARIVGDCLASGGQVLACGNGGSAADAQHFAGELVGRFLIPGRPALPALALTADSAILTAWANDVGFDQVFSRQVEAFGRPGDVLVGISTSGRSPNVLAAFATARQRGMTCIALTGGSGGDLAQVADLAIVVPAASTPRIQEVHILALHVLCELVENRLAAERSLAAAGGARYNAYLAPVAMDEPA